MDVEFPAFKGQLFSARRGAARQRALESVRSAWASASMSPLNLAQGRYNLGLASIVELTQAQLNVIQAEVENPSARYDYPIQYAALQYALGLLR